jgi:intracellular multiplication protein IcmO
MSILKDIKDVGLDVFISYHPIVVKLKRESKNLHKELKTQGFSLMQCQEIISKRYGFNNWHHFFQLIKKHYQIGLENIPFVITPKLEKNEHFLIGYDINFGHYKWQNENSMKTHQCIIGKEVFKDYDIFLAQQAIEKGNEVFFLNGLNDQVTLYALRNHAIAYRRQENLKIIDKNSELKLYNHFAMGSGGLAEIIYNCCDDEVEDGEFIKGRTISLLSSLIMALAYIRDTSKTVLQLEQIKESLELNKFIELSKGDLPEHIVISMKGYLNSLPDFNVEKPIYKSTLDFHIKLAKKIEYTIDAIIDLNILSNDVNSIHISRLLDRDKSIYIFNAENKIHHKFLASLLRQSFAKKLGTPLEGISYTHHYKKSSSSYNVFLREVNLPRGMSVVAAQSRSLGISLTYSYSSLSQMKEILGIECDSMLANTNTKIIGANENDAIDYLNLYKKEIIISNPNFIIHFKDEKIKDDYVWVMKHDDVSQVSFKQIKFD